MLLFSQWIGGYINGIKDIRLWGLYDWVYKSFCDTKISEIEAEKRKSMLSYINMNVDTLIMEAIVVIIYIYGGYLNIIEGQITIGGIIVFMAYASYVLAPVSSLCNIFIYFSGIVPSLKHFEEFISIESERRDGEFFIDEIERIEFIDASFAYIQKNFSINRANLFINKGDKVVIFGQNGSGKTTIINLLLGLYNCQQGNILINGKKIDDINLQNYRDKIAVASVDYYLFNDTIQNNLCLYNEVESAKMEKAISICGLKNVMKKKIPSYSVGENGNLLSAGQRQKLAIARAIISERKVMVLDEPTANLDIETRHKLVKYLLNKDNTKTIILVTHDLECLRQTQKIIYLRDGRIEDVGNYNELITRNKLFRQEIEQL